MEFIAKDKISGRTAQSIVSDVNRGNQTVLFRKDGRTINAGSLLGVLSLVISPDDIVEVIIEGEGNIIDTIKEYFKEN